MRKYKITIIGIVLSFGLSFGQINSLNGLKFIIGEWTGNGSGFGNKNSTIESSFQLVMDGKYIEVKNESRFEPTTEKPEGEHHIDQGFISNDKHRKSIIFRQFNSEGYVNQYVLQDSLSNDSLLVFESETIENFVPGGKARWTIKRISRKNIQTTFDVSFPNKDYSCMGINNLIRKEPETENTAAKVTGIGGIFFFAEQPNETKAWYAENLGLEINEWGSSFEFRNANHPEQINYLQWSPFKTGSAYFAPSEKDFMINYRVQNIESLVQKLKANGVIIVDQIETFDYGKFVHIMDADGNKLELWEPVDRVFTEMGGKTTK